LLTESDAESSDFLQELLGLVEPQKLQGSPSLFRNGLLLAQVPEKVPSFLPQILMASPAMPKPNKPIVNNTNFIIPEFGTKVRSFG